LEGLHRRSETDRDSFEQSDCERIEKSKDDRKNSQHFLKKLPIQISNQLTKFLRHPFEFSSHVPIRANGLDSAHNWPQNQIGHAYRDLYCFVAGIDDPIAERTSRLWESRSSSHVLDWEGQLAEGTACNF
jgi:hypothetical protein